MTVKHLELEADYVDSIISYTFSGGYDGGAYTLSFECIDHNLSIGNKIEVRAGYDGNLERVFTGYVKQISFNIPSRTYTITLYDELIRAVDYFIASSTPDTAYKIKNISAEALVGDVLSMAGITNYGYETTYFTFGVNGEGEVNLTGAYDFVHGIADLLAWHIYADKDGKVWFVDRKPYIVDDDVAKLTIGNTVLAVSPYTISDRDLRNRIVVYGNGVYAEAKADSPYLPTGFYKSVVLSSPYIDDQTFAQKSADYNLDKLNKLTEELMITIEGIPELYPLDVIELNNPNLPDELNSKWLVYAMETRFGNTGFIQDVTLRR